MKDFKLNNEVQEVVNNVCKKIKQSIRMSFKKNPSIEELKSEVELLQGQVVMLNSKLNASNRLLKNHPAQIELDRLNGLWWFRLFTWKWKR